MGRPSKQKQVAQKYFRKKLVKKGKLDCYECIFCFQTFAYNSWRMTKHLICCTKTTIDFQNLDLPIIKKLFENDKTPLAATNIQKTINDEYLIDNEGLTRETNQQSSSVSSTCSPQSFQLTTSSVKGSSSMKIMKIDRFINQEGQVNIKYQL